MIQKEYMKYRIKWELYWYLRRFMSWMYPCNECKGKGYIYSNWNWGPEDCDSCACSGIDLIG